MRLLMIFVFSITSYISPIYLEAAYIVDVDKVFAVHATRNLPKSDYLIAGWLLNDDNPLVKSLFPQVRKTLHFALGELVRPVEGVMNWEDCPYAVVTSLRNLLPQLINVNCYDTFILGDLKLNSMTYLIVPQDKVRTIESQAVIIGYDSETKTLRNAVDEFILSQGGWHIEMDNEDIEDVLHAAYLDDCNVNTLEFFKPLQMDRPWLSIGLRFIPLDGENYRLSLIEQLIISVAAKITSPELSDLKNSDLEYIINSINDHFEKWSQSLEGFDWCLESQKAYEELKAELNEWNNYLREYNELFSSQKAA